MFVAFQNVVHLKPMKFVNNFLQGSNFSGEGHAIIGQNARSRMTHQIIRDMQIWAEVSTDSAEYLHQTQAWKVENAMDLFYRENVTDGLFHEERVHRRLWSTNYNLTFFFQVIFTIRQWLRVFPQTMYYPKAQQCKAVLNLFLSYPEPVQRVVFHTSSTTYFNFVRRCLQHLSCYLPEYSESC